MTSPPMESEKPVSSRPPPPLPPPDFVTGNKLTAALYKLFSAREQPQKILASVLPPDVRWSNPLFDASSLDEVCEALDQFFSFMIEPTITIYSCMTIQASPAESSFSFEWTISFIYPLPWRPRVSLSGTTIAQTHGPTESVTSLTDNWNVSPGNIIIQSLPKLTDAIWLWPAPHAETDQGGRRVLRKMDNYKIIEQAPRSEFRASAFVPRNERELVYATPALPEECFEGGLRRKEIYSTVSPLEVRQLEEDGWYEWVVSVPGSHTGSSSVLLKAPLAECASVKVANRRVFAVRRYGGISSREIAEKELKIMVKALQDDGWWHGLVTASDVWVRLFDIKVGFNSSGLLAMCMYGSLRFLPRANEIAIEITGAWEQKG